jgi:hypothetical protein
MSGVEQVGLDVPAFIQQQIQAIKGVVASEKHHQEKILALVGLDDGFEEQLRSDHKTEDSILRFYVFGQMMNVLDPYLDESSLEEPSVEDDYKTFYAVVAHQISSLKNGLFSFAAFKEFVKTSPCFQAIEDEIKDMAHKALKVTSMRYSQVMMEYYSAIDEVWMHRPLEQREAIDCEELRPLEIKLEEIKRDYDQGIVSCKLDKEKNAFRDAVETRLLDLSTQLVKARHHMAAKFLQTKVLGRLFFIRDEEKDYLSAAYYAQQVLDNMELLKQDIEKKYVDKLPLTLQKIAMFLEKHPNEMKAARVMREWYDRTSIFYTAQAVAWADPKEVIALLKDYWSEAQIKRREMDLPTQWSVFTEIAFCMIHTLVREDCPKEEDVHEIQTYFTQCYKGMRKNNVCFAEALDPGRESINRNHLMEKLQAKYPELKIPGDEDKTEAERLPPRPEFAVPFSVKLMKVGGQKCVVFNASAEEESGECVIS